MMKLLALVLILASILGSAFAWMIEGEVTPHKGDSNTMIVLNYLLNEAVKSDARVKVYLNEYDAEENGFDYTIDKVLMDYFEVNPEDISPIILRLNNTASGFYRICLRLAHNGSYYRDCDKENQFLLINNNEPSVIIINSTMPAISVESEIMAVVNASEPFASIIKVTNNRDYHVNVTAYSYVYNKSKCVSDGSWVGNEVMKELQPRETVNFELVNKVNMTGVFDFKARIRYADGEYYDLKRQVIVLKKSKSKMFLNPVTQLNDSARLTVSNTGGAGGNMSLIIATINDSVRHDAVIKPMHSFEARLQLSNMDQNIYAYLFDNGFLIGAREFSFKKYFNETKTPEIKIENITNSSPASVENIIVDSYALEAVQANASGNMITGAHGTSVPAPRDGISWAFVINEELPDGFIETVLYLIIITVSIIGFSLLVRKF